MNVDVRHGRLEQLRDLDLRHPDHAFVEPALDPCLSVFGLVEDQLSAHAVTWRAESVQPRMRRTAVFIICGTNTRSERGSYQAVPLVRRSRYRSRVHRGRRMAANVFPS